MPELHSTLKTEEVGRADNGEMELVLMRLRHGRDSVTYSLHGRPYVFSSAGFQVTDLLDLLGFERSRCAFVVGGECYARGVAADFDLPAFAKALPRAYQALQGAERHLSACGLPLHHPQAYGYFFGRTSQGRVYDRTEGGGDGHTAPKSQRMKESADEAFQYVFTWLEGGDNKGWVTHYHPQHPPLSPEVEAALRYLGLGRFNDCPEFEFEPCCWRFTAYSSQGDRIWDRNADIAHSSFDSHAQQFAPGIEQLLAAQLAVEPFGMNVLPIPTHHSHTQPAARPGSTEARSGATPPAEAPSIVREAPDSYVFDVAFSFAGSERPIAERLNAIVIAAGFRAFYDDAYPEQLWGKELPVVFDELYRKQARYCVILVSPEYAARQEGA